MIPQVDIVIQRALSNARYVFCYYCKKLTVTPLNETRNPIEKQKEKMMAEKEKVETENKNMTTLIEATNIIGKKKVISFP